MINNTNYFIEPISTKEIVMIWTNISRPWLMLALHSMTILKLSSNMPRRSKIISECMLINNVL